MDDKAAYDKILADADAREDRIIAALQEQAEARVRAGESRAEVARSLGIPLSTLAGWAHRGGWRRKDLVAVRDAEMGQEAVELIAKLTAEECEKKHKQAAKMRELLDASKAELEAIAPDGLFPGALSGGPVPAHKLAWAMADSLLRQGRLEEADRAIRLAARFSEAEQAAVVREETNLREERERLSKWWADQQSTYHQLYQITDAVLADMRAAEELENSRSAADCCPKCGRRMDFWPEEVDRPGDDDDSDDGDPDDGDSGDDDSGVRSGDDDDSEEWTWDDDSGKWVVDDDDSEKRTVDDDFSSQPE